VKRIAAALLVVAGCGGGDDDGNGTTDGDIVDVPMNDCGCVGDRPMPVNPLDGSPRDRSGGRA
jgi:hypothetical protein